MTAPGGVRLAKVLGTMSPAVDLGLGQPMGHVARSCLLAGRLGALVGLDEVERPDLSYVTLMGCIADSLETSAAGSVSRRSRAGPSQRQIVERSIHDLATVPPPTPWPSSVQRRKHCRVASSVPGITGAGQF